MRTSTLIVMVLAAIGCEGPSGAGDAAVRDGATRDAGKRVGRDGAPNDPDSGVVPSGTRFTWDFEEGAIGGAVPTEPGAIPDTSGNGVDATAAPGLVYTRGQLAGAALALDGTTEGLVADAERVEPVVRLGADEPFLVEVVFRTDYHGTGGADGAGALVTYGDLEHAGWRLEIVDGRVQFTASADARSATLRLDELAADGRWHRVLAQRTEDGELVLALDGRRSVRAADATAGLPIAASSDVRVGSLADGGRRLFGDIDRVSFTRGVEVAIPEDVPERQRSQVFAGGTELQPGSSSTRYTSFRIPAIVRAPDGSLLAFAEARVHNACDHGDIEIVTKRSTDGGRTWSALTRIADFGTHKVGNPVPMVDYERGRVVVLVTFSESDPADPCRGIFDTRQLFAVASDDSGQTWGEVYDPGPPEEEHWPSYVVGPGHGIQLESGPHAGALVAVGPHRRAGAPERGGFILASEDGGETFRLADSEERSADDAGESTVVELFDGRLYVNNRRAMDYGSIGPRSRELGLRSEAYVTPELTYASDPAFTRTNAFRATTVAGSTLRWNGDTRPGNERRTLMSVAAGEHGTQRSSRHDLRVHASRDDTRTWSRGKRVDGKWAAYSDLVDVGDGRVGVLYESRELDTDLYYRNLDFVAFPVEWLDDDTLYAWTFEQHPRGGWRDTPAAGGYGGTLEATGSVAMVAGRHHSTAARFDGAARACTSVWHTRGTADFGPRDSFALDVVFRTEAHTAGATGTLVSRTSPGTEPAWWLRVQDGRLRFFVAACADADSLCGVERNTCAGLSDCSRAYVDSAVTVSDGEWHHARVMRDAASGALVMEVDGHTSTADLPTSAGFIKNERPICLGAFDDGSRAFEGEIDTVRLSLVD